MTKKNPNCGEGCSYPNCDYPMCFNTKTAPGKRCDCLYGACEMKSGYRCRALDAVAKAEGGGA